MSRRGDHQSWSFAVVPTFRYRVTGRVQGVGFRYHARRMAEAFDIAGTVRNLADGGVEIIATGASEHLRSFREQIELGPAGSRVDRVVAEECPEQRFEGFVIER